MSVIFFFVKDDSEVEECICFDIVVFFESLCVDFIDMDKFVFFLGLERFIYEGRFISLKWVFINLIENGVNYGEFVVIMVMLLLFVIEIFFDDNGFGIFLDKREEVFMFFYRFEIFCNWEIGGMGFGLFVVRIIICWYGGDIVLDDVLIGGLCVWVILLEV